jgi:hypothetical protein
MTIIKKSLAHIGRNTQMHIGRNTQNKFFLKKLLTKKRFWQYNHKVIDYIEITKAYLDSHAKRINNSFLFILPEGQDGRLIKQSNKIKNFGGCRPGGADGVLMGRGDKSNDYQINQKQSWRSWEYAQIKAAVPMA